MRKRPEPITPELRCRSAAYGSTYRAAPATDLSDSRKMEMKNSLPATPPTLVGPDPMRVHRGYKHVEKRATEPHWLDHSSSGSGHPEPYGHQASEYHASFKQTADNYKVTHPTLVIPATYASK
mmetsp:Transcript_39334/g.47664  ORF Transcript_39334/g.47664 Transcript_39334/m.47664 type:complete len:123 (-) Transcript_39334:757-1125(-)|eukprot:CAMPEP_0197848576 /NCGR_PEP_ID=MMETSP1438-20131217/9173_1 /TAXON_ID=1461541 /ORGANISM="Pterosperma sp., Strain CCMP1384" /LENGTH=122 /DNA_ID=CAMNT_0043460889 /DNA_START=85 /DNA_END=453 /DNA_ORIENTATION=+